MYKEIRIAFVATKTKSDKNKVTIFLRVFPVWDSKCPNFTLSNKICIDKSKWCKQKVVLMKVKMLIVKLKN